MSNGIGRVWAVNAEGGDEGRPNGVGPVWIENADQLGSKLPEPESGDAGKVLGVLNSDGDIGWVVDQEGMAQVQSDWDQTDSSQVSYIANKPNLATVATSGSYNDLSNKPTIPTVDQTYDASSTNAQSGVAVAGAIANSGLFEATYGTTTLAAVQNAISAHKIVYCRNADRMAFLAHLDPSQVEFQYYRSNAGSGDSVLVYAVTSSGWTTLERPAYVQSDWSTSDSSAASYIQNKPSIPTVDQTYNSASTNAQSGVAVAQAIAAIPSASYTAGDGIDITANAISANLDPKGLKITSGKIDINLATNSGLSYAQSTSSETLTVGGSTYYNGSIRLYNTSLSTYLDSASAADTFTLTIPGGVFGLGDIMPSYSRVLFAFCSNPVSSSPSNYAYIDVTNQLSLVEANDETQIGACSITLPAYMYASAGWSADVASHTYGFFITDEAMSFSGSGSVTASYTSAPSGLKVSNPLPASAVGDAGKVLKVDSNGDPEWATGGAQADWTESDPSDPSYVQNKPDVLSFVAGSGISITESASSITIAADAQIPSYNTTTDVGKVLQVTANGLAWVSLS